MQLEADVESLCLILREAEVFSSALKIAVQVQVSVILEKFSQSAIA